MRQSMIGIMLGCATALTVASGVAFAQGGGNGQGGSGGGNAHSAATAGMTYRGDPAPSPLDKAPGTMKPMSSKDTPAHSTSTDEAMNPPRTVQ